MKVHFEVFNGRQGIIDGETGSIRYRKTWFSWYWRLVASNGKIIADGSERYATKANAKRAVKRLQAVVGDAEIKEV